MSREMSALASVVLGVVAIVLPYLAGSIAVMLLGAAMLAGGILALLDRGVAGDAGLHVSVYPAWVQILAGVVVLFWPGLALWSVALVLGGGLVVAGISGLAGQRPAAGRAARVRSVEAWLGIAFGVLLVVMGAAGSAILLGAVLGVWLIVSGLRRWRGPVR